MASLKLVTRKFHCTRSTQCSSKLRPRNGRLHQQENSSKRHSQFTKQSVGSSSKRLRPSSKLLNPAKRRRLMSLPPVKAASVSGFSLKKRNIVTTKCTTKPLGHRNSSRIKVFGAVNAQNVIRNPGVTINRASRQAIDLCQQSSGNLAQNDSLQKMIYLLSLGLMPNPNSTKIQPPFVSLERLPLNKVKNFKIWQESCVNAGTRCNGTPMYSSSTRIKLRNNKNSMCRKKEIDQKPDPLRLGNQMTTNVQCLVHGTAQNNKESITSNRRLRYRSNNIENEPKLTRAIERRKAAEASRPKEVKVTSVPPGHLQRPGAKLISVPSRRTRQQQRNIVTRTFSIVTQMSRRNNVICIDLTDEQPHQDTYFKTVRSRLSTCNTAIHLICS